MASTNSLFSPSHQRNFSSATVKSEVPSSAFDDDDDKDLADLRKSKIKLFLGLILILITIVAGVGGGVGYMMKQRSNGDVQVLDTTTENINTTGSLSVSITSNTFSSTATSSEPALTSTSVRMISFGSSSTISSPAATFSSPTPTSISSSSSATSPAVDNVIKATTSIPSMNVKTIFNDFASSVISSSIPISTTFTPTTTTSTSQFSSSSSTTSISSSTPTNVQLNSFHSQVSTGVLTHFPGSQSPGAALACGDVYSQPATTLFAALCKTKFDSFPGSTSVTQVNENKSPACGEYVQGRKDLNGNWIQQGNGIDYAIVGGDNNLSCVGQEGIRCHIPLTISITYQNKTVKNVMIVDRNQGLGDSPCSEGDIDASDLVYRTLAGSNSSDNNAGLGINLLNISWIWE